jgi:Protein of unknown function (DUF732)
MSYPGNTVTPMTETPDPGGDDGETAVVPDVAPTMAASELAWSRDDETESVHRPPWGLAWAQSASVLLVAGVIAMVILAMGGSVWVLTYRQPAVSAASVAAPARAPTVVTVQAPPPSAVTVQAAPPPTVTVQAAPSTTTVTLDEPPEPSATHAAAPLPSFQPTVPVLTAEDQVFLARQRADRWVITDYQQMLRTAHQVCLMFRHGESAQQVNQWLASLPGPGQNSMQMALSFSSNVLLSYSEG